MTIIFDKTRVGNASNVYSYDTQKVMRRIFFINMCYVLNFTRTSMIYRYPHVTFDFGFGSSIHTLVAYRIYSAPRSSTS